jgi:cytochrome c-type biogenesis protein CcmH/NrfF
MRIRQHPLALLAVALLLVTAGTALWRSAAPRQENASTIAAQLLCPACQGESVAQSQSPMAAAMRDTIAQQLAAGRSPGQVRQWFVDRYGPGILADPPYGGLGILLWLLPAAAAAVLLLLLLRALRRRAPAGSRAPDDAATPNPDAGEPAVVEPTVTQPVASDRPEAAPAGARPLRARRTWDAVAVGVVALVGAVALAAPHTRAADAKTGDATQTTSTSTLLDLARSLEGQGRYPEAAQVYREVVQEQPDDDRTRLRLALTLLRSQQPAEAARAAQQVLDHTPGNTEALLMLGLAQRATGSARATATLRKFLAAAPDDPAATEVRRLLDSKS